MKKSNLINRNVQINDEVRNKVVQNIAESSNTNDHIFKIVITDGNLLNSKSRNLHAIVNHSTRRSNRLTEIENFLNNVDQRTNLTAFAIINEILIGKK